MLEAKRELIIDIETSALTPEKGEIIRYRAVNRWDEDDEFYEWATPSIRHQVRCLRKRRITGAGWVHRRRSDYLAAPL